MRSFLPKLGPPADMPKPAKGGMLDNALLGLLKAAGVDPVEIVGMIQGISGELKRHNELLETLHAKIDALVGIVAEVELLESIVRLTSPEANIMLHERDVAVGMAAGTLAAPEPPPETNGAFRSYGSLEEARKAALGDKHEAA